MRVCNGGVEGKEERMCRGSNRHMCVHIHDPSGRRAVARVNNVEETAVGRGENIRREKRRVMAHSS
eukprot:30868-Eustigmatos_ZCMA.PRE.1